MDNKQSKRNRFALGDKVCFDFDNKYHIGTVFVVDYRDSIEAPFFGITGAGYTYDIEVQTENTLYKHLPEHIISLFEETGGDGSNEV